MLPLFLNQTRYDEFIAELREHASNLSGKRILDTGCGYGMMLTHSRLNYELDVYGVEPSKHDYEGRFEIAQLLLADNGLDPSLIQCGTGEHMPFADSSFDIVYSFQVLEHVRDPRRVLMESWRVLKPGGVLYCNAPNYRTFWEGHYNIPWIPGIPKPLAKLYVRLLGRNPDYLDHLNFLSQPQLERWLNEICGFPVRSDFGLESWLNRMRSPVFSPYTNPTLIRGVRIADHLGILRLLALLGRWLKWQDMLRVAIRKPHTESAA
ncbi:MAG: class I SAM-dependent methyltransferase [Roseiflexaceae bacterium]